MVHSENINIVVDSPNCLVRHREDLRLIMLEWKEYPLSFDAYKTIFELALKYQQQYNGIIDNYMADVRKQPPVSVTARKWFTDEMLPRGIHSGIKRAAFVLNANVFKRYYMNEIFNSIKRFGIPFKFFNQTDNALDWIRKFNESSLQNTGSICF